MYKSTLFLFSKNSIFINWYWQHMTHFLLFPSWLTCNFLFQIFGFNFLNIPMKEWTFHIVSHFSPFSSSSLTPGIFFRCYFSMHWLILFSYIFNSLVLPTPSLFFEMGERTPTQKSPHLNVKVFFWIVHLRNVQGRTIIV